MLATDQLRRVQTRTPSSGGFVARLVWWLLQGKGWLLMRRRVIVFGNFTVIERRRIVIGRNCAINHQVFLNGSSGITIGNNVVLSARSMLIAATLDARAFCLRGDRGHIHAPISIGDDTWVGAGAIILGGVTVGSKCVIGAGAVVTADVPHGSIVAGNPARRIGMISDRGTG